MVAQFAVTLVPFTVKAARILVPLIGTHNLAHSPARSEGKPDDSSRSFLAGAVGGTRITEVALWHSPSNMFLRVSVGVLIKFTAER